ncbi:hypothetical protein SAMN05216570_1283 [Dyella sp. OK004]|uniref:hypothetical protein n=1 Tax=Dyella sp. OK004 TaxID=1855292 RepID=UPI0008DF74B3|nr:hypothetical protein [Dyella sp. OK004]SFR95860.1 hypothetical protein SAMN05216570_1283 [Dyella sp. OK004]
MSDFLQRVLQGYRPLYLRGLLLDGQHRLPVSSPPATKPHGRPASTTRPPRLQTIATVAMTGLCAGAAIAAAGRPNGEAS